MLGLAIVFGCATTLAGLAPSQTPGGSGGPPPPAAQPTAKRAAPAPQAPGAPAPQTPGAPAPQAPAKPTAKGPAAPAPGLAGSKKTDPAAAALLEKVQRYYDATRDYSADFLQSYTRVALSKVSESSGRVMIKKPGMMRWEYKLPAEKLFVADGSKLYVYEPEEQQVIIDPNFKTAELSTSISFLWGEGRLADSFHAAVGDAERYQAPKGAQVLELVPKKDATYTKLVLVLDPKTNQVTESILFETSGNTNRFKFKTPAINTGLKADAFKFTPPPGVEIIQRP